MKTNRRTFWAAALLMVTGIMEMFSSMSHLGLTTSLRKGEKGLRTSGPYCLTCHRQIVAYFLVVLSTSLLWPSWGGAHWLMHYGMIGHLGVRTGERHLLR